MRSPASVLIVEDSPLVRREVRDALLAGDFHIAGEAGSAVARDVAAELQPDITIVGLRAGETQARERVRAVLEGAPGTLVVAIAAAEERDIVISALRGGARGLLSLRHAPTGLVRALRGLMRGEAPLSREAVNFLVDEVQRRDRRLDVAARMPRGDRLTPRQVEILRLLAEGQTTAEVAGTLYLSVETVRWHVKTILRKLGVGRREEAIAYLADLAEHEVVAR